MLTDNRSANSTNSPSLIFLTSLPGTGACPGPIANAFGNCCCEVDAPSAGILDGKLADETEENVDEIGASGRAELEAVMADMHTGVKVEIKGGRENVPGEEATLATGTRELVTVGETAEVGTNWAEKTALETTDDVAGFDDASELGAFT